MKQYKRDDYRTGRDVRVLPGSLLTQHLTGWNGLLLTLSGVDGSEDAYLTPCLERWHNRTVGREVISVEISKPVWFNDLLAEGTTVMQQ